MSSYPTSPPQGVEQHCYRHAYRRAGVTCQRCNRPICPSCMISASVGFQCPECSKQGAKQQRLVDVFKQTTPHLTYALIAVNVLVYLVGVVADRSIGGIYGSVNGRFGVLGDVVFRTSTGNIAEGGVAVGEWWRIVTGGFLHANLIHLGMNMYVLYLIGGAMERVIGKLRFGLIYGVSLIGGSLGALILSPDTLTVGASGAVFGLFAALACLQLSRGQNPMQGGIGQTIVLNLVITFAFSSFISVGGHLGGLVVGGICGAILFGINPAQARSRASRLTLLTSAVGLVGVLTFAGAVAAAYAA